MLRSVVVWSHGSLTQICARHCSDQSLSFAAQRCKNLEVLAIKGCQNVTDRSMAQIGFHCQKLRELDISYCYEISHESLSLIGQHCPNLRILKRNFMNWLVPFCLIGIVPKEYLNACARDGDSEASTISKYMPTLEHLELRFSKLTVKGLSLICEGCKNLKYLDLSGCVNLTSPDILNASSKLKGLEIKRPTSFIPRLDFHTAEYDVFRIY